MDRTDLLLTELKYMIDNKNFDDEELRLKVKAIITDIQHGKLNIIDFRHASSRQMYGDNVIDLFIEANNRVFD